MPVSGFFFGLLLIIVSWTTCAQTELTLKDGKLAYYGKDFYISKKFSKSQLFTILDQYHQNQNQDFNLIKSSCLDDKCFKHSSVGYTQARTIMFSQLFMEKDAEGTFVKDVYCEKKIYFDHVSEISNMGQIVNIEHTWPQSKFTTRFDKNLQKSDMHHLFPTDSTANSTRGNHIFGEKQQHSFGGINDCSPSSIQDTSGRLSFTPPKIHKGNVARALFYFSTRYNLTIDPVEEMILRQWHIVDPVDQDEIRRHEIIAKHQKVRNPYIDFPSLVEKISDF
jgi:deoxyribonuclease-1